MSATVLSLPERWKTLLRRVAELRSGTNMIAVSKGQPVESIGTLLKAGQRDFAENRVQEASAKWPGLKMAYPDLRLHLIGPLQTNKVKEALALFDIIQTVDREGLVDALAKHPDAIRQKQFFLQVNTGGETQKSGVAPEAAATLLKYCRDCGLPVSGLMCIPPANEPPAPHFALLHTLAKELGLPDLSMGMSGDFEIALRLGATHVRIGTALFGPRT